MTKETSLNHVGLQCSERKKAEIFFTKVLQIPKIRTFEVSEELSKAIFGIKNSVEIDVYNNGKTKFEVFITEKMKDFFYEHVCIEVDNKKEFTKRCKKYGIEPLLVRKEGKDLLFIRDFSDNLYEIKEKQ